MAKNNEIAFWACPDCLQKVSRDQKRCHHCTTVFGGREGKHPFPCDSNGNRAESGSSIFGVIVLILIIFFMFSKNDTDSESSKNTSVKTTPVVEEPNVSESPAVQNTTTFLPSFSCARVSSVQERLICDDSELAELDVNLNQAYVHAKTKIADESLFKEEQKIWLHTVRDSCQDKNCLKEVMNQRIFELSN